MMKIKNNKYPVRFARNDIGNGYRYFNDMYSFALELIGSGKKEQGFRILRKGSRRYHLLFKKGYPLSEHLVDNCSCYLVNYYERHGKYRKLKRIRERNFVEYRGEYFLLTTHESLTFRLIPLNELDGKGDYDYGIDLPLEQQVVEAVQHLVKEKRGVSCSAVYQSRNVFFSHNQIER